MSYFISVIILFCLIYLLPLVIVPLRNYMFTRIEKGINIPNKVIDGKKTRMLYASKQACIRSRDIKFANLVWYLVAPGSQFHQEVMEEGLQYDAVSTVTRQILNIPSKKIAELVRKHTEGYFKENLFQYFSAYSSEKKPYQLVHLRDFLMPIWTRVFSELVFGKTCYHYEERHLTNNTIDFISVVKFLTLPNMKIRQHVITWIAEKLNNKEFSHLIPKDFTIHEAALYLRGTFFTSAISQMSEAVTHILLCLAQHQSMQQRLADSTDRVFLNNVINESLRLYPLFGVAFRGISEDIDLGGNVKINKGEVVFLNFTPYHRLDFADPDRFDPDRWLTLKKSEANFLPFGHQGNHACPAHGFAKIAMCQFIEVAIKHFQFYSSAKHERPLYNRGPCIITIRGKLSNRLIFLLLIKMKFIDILNDFLISLKQVPLGLVIMRRAKKLKLAEKYYK